MTTPLRPAPSTDTLLDEVTDERTETGPPKAAHIVKVEPGESAVAKVTAADVQRVATQYFAKSNRTVAVLVKKHTDKTVAAVSVGEVRP